MNGETVKKKPTVSSFRYNPSKNAKVFAIHPHYEKHLKATQKHHMVSSKQKNKSKDSKKQEQQKVNTKKQESVQALSSTNIPSGIFQMGNNTVFYSDINDTKHKKLVNKLFKNMTQELEKQKRLEIEKQKRLELEIQKRLELEKQKLLELEKQKRLELEIQKKRELELEKQKQLEIQKKRELKLEKQLNELEKQSKLELERQRLELEKQRKLEIEKKIPKPKVTIIVPMYNVEQYISSCVMSLLRQTYNNIEIILVNDYSTDSTKKVVNDLIEQHPDKIKVIDNNKNVGTYISINTGIVNSDGDFITIIGADDQFTPDKVEKQVNYLLRHKKVVACYCEYKRIHYQTKKLIVQDIGESTIMFRRGIVKHIGYYDSVRYGADSEYQQRIKMAYGRAATGTIRKVMYIALLRPNSLTVSKKTKNGSSTRKKYRESFNRWHRSRRKLYIGFPMKKRPFWVPPGMM